MDEHRAIRLLKRGDLRGLEWLVNQFHDEATKVACLITGDLQQAEDVVQEAFINVYDAIGSFDDSRPFRPWFIRSVSNRAVRKAQEQSRLIPLDMETIETYLPDLLISDESTIEDQIEFSELVLQLESAIMRLNPRQREAVIQRYYLDMNEKEMAEKLALAPGTVKWHLHKARKFLCSHLSERE